MHTLVLVEVTLVCKSLEEIKFLSSRIVGIVRDVFETKFFTDVRKSVSYYDKSKKLN